LNTAQIIVKNWLSLSFVAIVSKLLSFILTIYIARYLGDVGLGKYSFALAFTGLFIIFSDIGLSRLTIREVARDKLRAESYLSNAATIKSILSLATFGLIFFIINLLNYPVDTTVVVYIIGLSAILHSFARLFQAIFNAFERMEYETITTAVELLIVVGLGVCVLILGYGLIGLAYVILIASIINVLFSLFITIKVFTKPKFKIDWKFWKSTVKEALPFGLTTAFVTVYFQIDTVMLSIMKDDAVVGWYNAAYRLIFALMFIPTAFVGSIFPIISRFFVSSQNSLKVAYEKTFKYLIIIGIPLAIGTTILADRIVLIIYGKDFNNSVVALQILIWVALLMFLTYLIGTVLESVNRQGRVSKVAGINALVNVFLNLLLIPKFSFIGASVATVATEAIGFILLFHSISKHLHAVPLFKLTLKPLIASLPMSLFIFYFKEINTVMLIAVAVLLYFGMIYCLRAVSEEDIGLFRRVFKKEATTLYRQ